MTPCTSLHNTDYGRPVRKSPSLHGRKFTPTPKFLGTAKAYFVCHIGPNFQISLINAFIGRPYSVNILERHPIFLSSGGLERASSGLSGLVFTFSSTVRQHNNKNSRFLRLPTTGCSLNSKQDYCDTLYFQATAAWRA